MLYLSQKEFEDMENLCYICNGKPHKDVIHLILHSGAIASQYNHLSKLHKYDVLGAVLTGEYKHRPSPSSVLESHLKVARTKEPSQAYALQSLFSELESLGFIKEGI